MGYLSPFHSTDIDKDPDKTFLSLACQYGRLSVAFAHKYRLIQTTAAITETASMDILQIQQVVLPL